MRIELTLIELNFIQRLLTEKVTEIQTMSASLRDYESGMPVQTVQSLLRKVNQSLEE
jgi:hypothetical protein